MLHTKKIYIYSGPGASTKNISQLVRILNYSFENIIIELVNKNKISKEFLQECDLFILPGGRDKLYAKYLNGNLNKIIKEYIMLGGSFLGICAGAYYCGTNLEFAKGSDKEIIEKRELALFNGKVIGPVLGEYFYNSTRGSKAAKIMFQDKYTYMHYNGGGYFDFKDDLKILAYYMDPTPKLPAIIEFNVGKGLVVLSGVHFEYCNPLNYDHTNSLNIKLLKESDAQNRCFFKEVISYLMK